MLKLFVFLLNVVLSFTATTKLGLYNIDTGAISVSGLSSGGFMAVQMHVIESKTFMGVGVNAGGPYYCAKQSLSTALNACMASPSMINVNSLISNTEIQSQSGNIDPYGNLENSRVYLYSGTRDNVVMPGVVQKAEEFYKSFVLQGNIKTEYDIDSQHGFGTMNKGGPCAFLNRENYINDCGYDTAYHILNHIYGGDLQVPSYSLTASPPAGTLMEFDQTEFVDLSPSSISMDTYGYIFVPDTCTDGSRACKLHVSFHGCHQAASGIGDTYVTDTGYNEVGALNDIIILSPQAKAGSVPYNPKGCWDFWGYTDSNYAYHSGKQVATVMKMVKRVTGGLLAPTSTAPSVVPTEDPAPITTTTAKVTTGTTKSTTAPGNSNGLGSYKADKSAVSVSGLSAGAFMATQMHVAASDAIMGAGAVAGGPYYCAMNNIGVATTYCMYMPYMINTNLLESQAESYESAGTVGTLTNLQDDRVYLYSGSKDTVVLTGVVEKAAGFYQDMYVGNIKTEYSIASQNGFPTVNKGGPCDKINDNGLNSCGFAGAFEILNQIYGGNLQAPDYSSSDPPKGQLIEFSQTEFTGVSEPTSIGLGETGMVFVPTACTSGNSACRIHVAFHGCKHGDDTIAEDFAKDAGYNEVAASNNIIVLYPRTAQIYLTNPQDCWDWWGYTDKHYATTEGVQIAAVLKMIEHLVS